MKECCANCANNLKGEKWDYGKIKDGNWKEPLDGYICTALAFEGKAVQMIDDPNKGMCEMYRARK